MQSALPSLTDGKSVRFTLVCGHVGLANRRQLYRIIVRVIYALDNLKIDSMIKLIKFWF